MKINAKPFMAGYYAQSESNGSYRLDYVGQTKPENEQNAYWFDANELFVQAVNVTIYTPESLHINL